MSAWRWRNIRLIYAEYPHPRARHGTSASIRRTGKPSRARSHPPLMHPLLLTKIWETGMQGARTSSCRPEIIERSVPQDAHLLTGSQMAWEILRRRADYRGQPCERTLLRTSPSLQLIRTCRPLTSWGLCFRGRSGPDSTRRPPFLGGSGGHERHMRFCAAMSVHRARRLLALRPALACGAARPARSPGAARRKPPRADQI